MTGVNERTLTGGCQCGAVRFRVTGKLSDASVCHCRMCQKAIGAPVGAFVSVRRENVVWTRGQPALFRSSNVASRGFCPQCGTSLTWETGDLLDLAIFALDDPDAVTPAYQLAAANRASWLADIETLPERPVGAGPLGVKEIISYQHPDHETASSQN